LLVPARDIFGDQYRYLQDQLLNFGFAVLKGDLDFSGQEDKWMITSHVVTCQAKNITVLQKLFSRIWINILTVNHLNS